ncbi:MAG: hypothetical protein Q8P18_26515 [Pseudomonadota bacterium]|nr:hypothetical protein [Pseudomonadota bacterium]
MSRLPWILAGLLLASCAWNVRALLASGPGFVTLPIFVPVSLEYERQMRAARGQAPGRGGEEAVALARALAEEPGLDPALAPQVNALRATRERLLDARGRRHALNIALMDVGVAVASELTPAQWGEIHMKRDTLRARTEAEVFDRLLEKLR